ncbi:hypothetical protein MKJ04_07295 [Pontibacter sp. E15-1]|uniref:hypothetical protein n=1 Tax=Pontibacter sp. E15-1 TaxID=2919918 RepID=UPI001F4FE4AF|nr:hypothetical protein [Pontibacter sp. E15-1]MCJ8164646.1 hypothetical protein [Pontibacter sp. E15-1]
MKHYIILIAMCCALTLPATTVQAQSHKHEQREKVEAAKVAFLTDKMGLTPEQSQKFWPIYNEHEAKRRELVKGYRIDFKQDIDLLTDAQVEARVAKIFDLKEKELALDKVYAERYQKVITIKQLVKMYRGEREFMKLLLRRLDDKKQNQ